MSSGVLYIGFPIWRGSGGVGYAMREALRRGFDFVEIDLETLKPGGVRGSRIRLGYHAPYTIPLSHPYLLRDVRRYLSELVVFAERTGAEYINIHMNHPTYYRLEKLNNSLRREAVKTIKHLRRASSRTVITLENPPRGDYSSCEKLVKAAEEAGVKICLDVGHLAYNMLKQADVGKTTREIRRCIKQSRSLLFLLHLHNVRQNRDGETEDHMLEGDLNLVEIAAAAVEVGCRYILLETFFKGGSAKREVTLEDACRLMQRIKKELLA